MKYQKALKVIIPAVCILLAVLIIVLFVDVYHHKLHINTDKISSVYVVNGLTDKKFEMTGVEIETVKNELNELEFEKTSYSDIYRMCIVVETEDNERYVIKRSDDPECVNITGGAKKLGYYKSEQIVNIIKQYESDYGVPLYYDD